MSCKFCLELDGADEYDRWWHQDVDWAVGPTLGHFTPGYLLMVPIAHHNAIANCSGKEIAAAAEHVGRIRNVLSRRYGPVVVAEHGSGGVCNRGAACCDHAHLHFIPFTNFESTRKVKGEYIQRDPEFTLVRSLHDLRAFAGKPYLYISTAPDEHLVWVLEKHNQHFFPRQFVRQVCASVLGTPHWDWRDAPLIDEMMATRDALAEEFGPFIKRA